ncbi:HNH endonuclease [Oceanisphaera profunda]|uniref:HNH endonuclease n=1 Tax=Oceanisphaera profunda TaxID=1416627 RepID=A0A1Y0D937_9GAMM|nr:HNH endonuclease [Oceanisphaera profunda]ART83794.1 HNH endonuclease [Oceanisphaera profunda]
MVKLERANEPEILIDNKAKWTSDLLTAVRDNGGYKKIPAKDKEKLITYYRHQAIKDSLFPSSENKCAFCECKPSEGGNIEVEHFEPKSIYPDKTFEWTNFLPCCRRCNGDKSDHDTVVEPILNPYDENPSNVFFYEDIQMKVQDCDLKSKGLKTIEVCGLNSLRLWKPRAALLINLRIFSSSIEDAIKIYSEAETDRKKNIRIKNIREAVDTIEMLIEPSEKYSHFCSVFLHTCASYQKAKKVISEHG